MSTGGVIAYNVNIKWVIFWMVVLKHIDGLLYMGAHKMKEDDNLNKLVDDYVTSCNKKQVVWAGESLESLNNCRNVLNYNNDQKVGKKLHKYTNF